MTIYATFRHPKDDTRLVPGVLLIAGSGPTDRNGNSSLIPGSVDTLKTLADWLSEDGVASLRYDKLGSGRTGLGPYAAEPASIGISVSNKNPEARCSSLAKEKVINDRELGVFGHSEGALFALLLATGHAGAKPPIHALGLFEPLSQRYLDLLTDQVDAELKAQVHSGAITTTVEKTVEIDLSKAVTQLRTSGTVKPICRTDWRVCSIRPMPGFGPRATGFDPETLAARSPKDTGASHVQQRRRSGDLR